MRWTPALRQVASAAKASVSQDKKRKKALALSVYFKQPEFGMKDYEILSRATAYLLGVDPPEDDTLPEGPYAHLEASEQQRKAKNFHWRNKFTPVAGAGREVMDLRWLEFVPREVRPRVHLVCSSHVVSPFLWKDYYPQDWLNQVRPEHCMYAVEVYEAFTASAAGAPLQPPEALVKLALGPDVQPYHHPEGRDLALLHFREEASSLKILEGLGVDILHLRDPDKLYQKGETMIFDGFVVSQPNTSDSASLENVTDPGSASDSTNSANEDLRVFYPYSQDGTLSFHTDDRFFAHTDEPLSEGMCGAPVLDVDGALCGTVEGIVPVTHSNAKLAGSAAFMPSHVMKAFVDYVERGMLKQMMPDDLFDMVVTAKSTNSLDDKGLQGDDGEGGTKDSDWEEVYDTALENLKRRYSPEEVQAILNTVERERDEVLEILDKEGGDMDEIMRRVRTKTLQIREMVVDQVRKAQEASEREGTKV